MSSTYVPESAGAGQSSAKTASKASRFKIATHALAAAMFTAVIWLSHFATSPAGQALVKQYPKLSVAASVATAAAGAAAFYFTPKS